MARGGGLNIYNLFPRLVGSIAHWHRHLDRIAAMGFDWVFVNPIHATGFSGSLYAVQDYYRLNPLFDDGSGRSGDDQLREFLAAASKRGLRVMFDLVINHTARDAVLIAEHGDWYRRDDTGAVISPRAVDPDDPAKTTVWGDLAELDWRPHAGRAAMVAWFAAVAQHYLRCGGHGFRCDAAYQVPGDAWADLIATVRRSFPDAVFTAETLGCRPPEVMQLAASGFDALFNSVKWWDYRSSWLLDQYETFRAIAPSIGFPESHDTPRLAAELPPETDLPTAYRQRYLVAALFSAGVLMPIGYERGFRRPLHVVETSPADWEQGAFDLSDLIGATNRLRLAQPVFLDAGPQQRLCPDEGPVVGLWRHRVDGSGSALTLINTDSAAPHTLWSEDWPEVDWTTLREVTPLRPSELVRPGMMLGLAPGDVRVFVTQGRGRQ